MTLAQLTHLEEIVGEGVRLRNKSNRMEALKGLFLELDNTLPGGVVKIAEIRMAANGAELRFVDLSNQSRNVTLEISTDDGRKLVAMFHEFLTKQIRAVAEKIEGIKT